ncbi:3180_t:CDS:2, partial [Diversispora eburnea]
KLPKQNLDKAFEKDPALETSYRNLKKQVEEILTEAENAANILKARDDEKEEITQKQEIIRMPEPHSFSRSSAEANIDTSNQPSKIPISPSTTQGLSPSPVYIVGNNMIGNITSTSNSNITSMVPINETSKNLKNNGFNPDSMKNLKNYNNNDKSNDLKFHNNTIQASELQKYLNMKEDSPKILVLDVRLRTEFEKDIENKLIFSPKHEKELFDDRHKFDLVVYHNQDSSYVTESKSAINKSIISHSSSIYNSNDTMQYLYKAIFDTEFTKRLKRSPVLLNGGFNAWYRLTGEAGIERNTDNTTKNITQNIIQINQNERENNNNLRSDENDRRILSSSPKEIIDSYDVNNFGSYIKSYMDFYSQPKFTIPPPNKPLPSPTSTTSQTNTSKSSNSSKSETSLKRRKTIFDHPYYSFIPNNDTQILMPNRPSPMEQNHHRLPTSESSFSQLGSGIGTTGLKNLGNTCFMNSIIQCLSGTVPFARYFLDGSYKRHINKVNPLGSKGVLVEAFAELIRVMWDDKYTFVSPILFKEAIGRFAPQFSGSDQHDSQEFLEFLLDGLHEDLNVKQKIKELTPTEEKQMESLHTGIVSEIMWERYLRKNNSVIVSLFQGQFRNQLICSSCKNTSTTYSEFMYLSLPIPKERKGEQVNLEMCLKNFVKEEILDGDNSWYCSRCECHRQATKQLTISRLPDVLLIHLKRFSFNGPFRDKLDTYVDFPIRNLDLTEYMPYEITQKTKNNIPGIGGLNNFNNLQQTGPYDLYAVSNHYGSLNGGHYTACVRNGYRQEWHNFDDSRVSVCDIKNVKSRAAYNLFYVRKSIK